MIKINGQWCHTEETKKQMSESRRGKNNAFYGKQHIQKTKQKISLANKGKPSPNKGVKLSEETKRKIGKAQKGKTISDSHKKALSERFKGKGNNMYGKTPWKGKHHTEETKQKISQAVRGERNGSWKGGSSLIDLCRTGVRKWREIAKIIRKRDNYICQQCNVFPAYEVHHIIPFRISHNDKPNNLITLCKKCHLIIEPKKGNLSV